MENEAIDHDATRQVSGGVRPSVHLESALTSLLQPGETFANRYTIIKLLGAGGMAVVYQAWDASLGMAIALKLIRLDGVSAVELQHLQDRFKRELRLARQVTHANVVRIHDLGEVGQTLYLTMELVQGADLASVIRKEGRLPVERVVAITRQIVAGLAGAHAAGVVHRDLKPGNIMVAADGRALLTDFGIARSTASEALQTLPGSIVGTVAYLAPEQAEGRTADQRTDVYALGLIVYELLTGGRPFATMAGGLADLVARLKKGATPLQSVNADVPADLAHIVSKCLEPDPAARYQSAAELQTALSLLGPDGRRLHPPAVARMPWWFAAAAVAIAAALISGIWWGTRPTAPPPTPIPKSPMSVLIADFTNNGNDPVFTGSLEPPLAVAVEGSSFITAYPRHQASVLARQMRPGTEQLDESAARLVAMREGIRIVLAGAIESDQDGYRIRVKALDPSVEAPLAEASARAANKADVLAALGKVAASIREALGDTTPSNFQNAETFTAGSLDALRSYTIAQELANDQRDREAIEKYREAVAYDPQFGRAYAGWAASLVALGRRSEAEEKWKSALALMDRMTEREKLRTYGGHYIFMTKNYEKAIENYSMLVAKYPADSAGHSNLAISYFYARNFTKALDEGRQALEIYPRSLKFRTNYALYLMYAGEFQKAAAEAQRVLDADRTLGLAYLPLAMAALAEDKLDQAQRLYERAATAGGIGPSLAATGLSDIAMYRGNEGEAIDRLVSAIAADRQEENTVGVATKSVALGEAHVVAGRSRDAEQAIAQAVKLGKDESILVPIARSYVALNRPAEAQRIIADLSARLQPESRAYARLLEAELALKRNQVRDAIAAAQEARRFADLWLVRFILGLSYFHADRHAEALSEFETCTRRIGEATALFFDDQPTFRYVSTMPYWLGRSQEALGQRDAALMQYRKFLALRTPDASDPLVTDARQRTAGR